MSSVPGGSRTIKKGELIFKEGDKVQNLFLVQSGQIAVQIVRGKPIDLFGIGPNQVLGDYILAGVSTHPFNAIATVETKVLELPFEAVKAQVEASPQIIKLLTKSSLDRLKGLQNDLKSIRLERDSQACPPDQLAKIFATVYHVSRYKGEVKKDGSLEVSWLLMKQYAQRLFLESPKRLEAAVKIFVKLKLASLTMQENPEDPDAPEEISTVTFKNVEIVEWVSEHWQYYYFKGGKTELLKTDEKVMQVVAALVAYGSELEADRNGAVRIEFSQIVERFKGESGITLNADFFGVIENKGLFVKRVPTDKGVLVQFEYKEFARWSQIWAVLKEIEKWNEKGTVDMEESAFDPRKFQKSTGGNQCPSCGNSYEGAPKFCGECGQKLTVAA